MRDTPKRPARTRASARVFVALFLVALRSLEIGNYSQSTAKILNPEFLKPLNLQYVKLACESFNMEDKLKFNIRLIDEGQISTLDG